MRAGSLRVLLPARRWEARGQGWKQGRLMFVSLVSDGCTSDGLSLFCAFHWVNWRNN